MSANEKLNIALRQEISAITPNRVDDLLARLGEQPPLSDETPVSEIPAVTRMPNRLRRQLIAAVLALVVLGGGIFYGVRSAQRSVVILDADAPVAFTVDGFDRVRSVRLEDSHAVSAVDAGNLSGKRLDKAVAEVTEQLIERDLLSSDENAVLLSVQEDGKTRADALAKKANNALTTAAAGHEITPVVVMQTIPENASSINGASLGKTAYVDKLVGGIEGKETADLVHASLEDLMYFSNQKGLNPEQVKRVGTLNEAVYYTADNAVAIACADAGYDPSGVETSALLGWENTDLVYLATVNAGSRVGYYCISARTGEILNVYWEELNQTQTALDGQTTPPTLPGIPSNTSPGTSLPDISELPSMPATSNFDIDSIIHFFELWDDII